MPVEVCKSWFSKISKGSSCTARQNNFLLYLRDQHLRHATREHATMSIKQWTTQERFMLQKQGRSEAVTELNTSQLDLAQGHTPDLSLGDS